MHIKGLPSYHNSLKSDIKGTMQTGYGHQTYQVIIDKAHINPFIIKFANNKNPDYLKGYNQGIEI